MYLKRFEPTCIGEVRDAVKSGRVFIKAPDFIGVDYLVGSDRCWVAFVCLTRNESLSIDHFNFDEYREYYKLDGNFDAIELPKIIDELMKGGTNA